MKHRIDTGDARSIRQTSIRLSLAMREKAMKMIREMEQENVFDPSSSPWTSPVVKKTN